MEDMGIEQLNIREENFIVSLPKNFTLWGNHTKPNQTYNSVKSPTKSNLYLRRKGTNAPLRVWHR